MSTGGLDAQSYFAKGFLLAFGPVSQRNLKEGISCLEIAQQLDPNNIQYLNTLSEAYLQTKRFPLALYVATKANNLIPGNLYSLIALGRAAWFCGEQRLALDSFATADRLVPSARTALKKHLSAITFGLTPFWQEPRKSKRITLVRMEPKHRDFLLSCRKDVDFQNQYHLFQDSSPEAVERDLYLKTRSPIEIKRISWIVESNLEPIGLAELVDLNFNNSRAEILVGFPKKQAFGVSLEATLLIMEFAFSVVGFYKLISYVYGDNPNSQRNTMHLGFKQEGLLKSHVINPVSKERLDLYINGCLATEFFQNKPLMKLAKRLLGRIPEPNHQEQSCDLTGVIDVNKLVMDLPWVLLKK